MRAVSFGPVVTREFTFKELIQGLAGGAIQKWLAKASGVHKNGKAIYRISATTPEGAKALSSRFDKDGFGKNKSKTAYKLPKRNDLHEGPTLYFGSSTKISTRLREHLKKAHTGTYALHLMRWCPPKDYSVLLEVQAPDDDVQPELLQEVEDALWD
jgi:hypothetical protein